MATPLVDWGQLVIPSVCIWSPGRYRLKDPGPAARERATALLLAHLDEQQRGDYLRMRRFAARGASGVVYVMGRELYPTALVNGKASLRFCAPPHPCHFSNVAQGYEMPMEDLVLTWKLFIEGDEQGFLAVASPSYV